jgi:hypothetical protein
MGHGGRSGANELPLIATIQPSCVVAESREQSALATCQRDQETARARGHEPQAATRERKLNFRRFQIVITKDAGKYRASDLMEVIVT